LVFISHDSRDSEIAEAFGNLLSDVSVGTLKTFRSSDNLGTSGIAFGDEWYEAIVSKLGEATDVVALLTTTSVDRPWILYEAGIAAGKLNTRVIGIAIGLPLSKAVTGPFSQFQNSADDEQSLTKLMIQLLQRNPDAAPRQETVGMHVRAFRERIAIILKSKGNDAESIPPSEEENVAILVEEIKGMLRELPDRIGDRALSRKGTSKSRRIDIRAMEEIAFGPIFAGFENGPAMAFLTLLSMLKDELPWLYEPGMEFYRSLNSKARTRVQEAAQQMHELVEFSLRGPLRGLVEGDDKIHFATRIMHELIERAASMPIRAQDRPSLKRKRIASA
jgi:TIR domain-containing protein